MRYTFMAAGLLQTVAQPVRPKFPVVLQQVMKSEFGFPLQTVPVCRLLQHPLVKIRIPGQYVVSLLEQFPDSLVNTRPGLCVCHHPVRDLVYPHCCDGYRVFGFAQRLKPLPAGSINQGDLDNLSALPAAGRFGIQDEDIFPFDKFIPWQDGRRHDYLSHVWSCAVVGELANTFGQSIKHLPRAQRMSWRPEDVIRLSPHRMVYPVFWYSHSRPPFSVFCEELKQVVALFFPFVATVCLLQ